MLNIVSLNVKKYTRTLNLIGIGCISNEKILKFEISVIIRKNERETTLR